MVLNIFILALLSMLNTGIGGESLYEKNFKRANKTISKLWENQAVDLKKIDIDPAILGSVKQGPLEIYTINTAQPELPLAFLCFSQAPSKVDNFTFLVVYNPDLSIKHVEVLEYRENYGGEISSKRFLKQFQGITGTEEIIIGKDIDGISGATISVKSIVRGVRILNEQMMELRNLGLI